MTVYVVEHPLDPDVTDITLRDIERQGKSVEVQLIAFADDPLEQLDHMTRTPMQDGDIICFAGTALRTKIWNMVEVSLSLQKNLMPGRINDHRGVEIPSGKFLKRKTQEANGYPGVPYVMVLGDAIAARQSWRMAADLDHDSLWKSYRPEKITVHHYLSAVALSESWLTPSWFSMVDLSKHDLEVTPTTYATTCWHDWLAFFPAGGRFKIENHSQLDPVWLDDSKKPMEHWGYVRD